MRSLLFVAFILIAAIIAWSFVQGGTNINAREAYWTPRIDAAIKPGATQAELDAFANANGQVLECYENSERQDQCSFTDPQSHGGTSNLPMRLIVMFAMKDERVVSHAFATTAAPLEE